MNRLLPLLLLLPLAAGCRTVVQPPEGEVDRWEVYQTIANALPWATYDWGTRPRIVDMSASARREGLPPRPIPLLATEKGFRILLDVYRPHVFWVPYKAIREVSWSWKPLPNVIFCLLMVFPFQSNRCTVAFDTTLVPGLPGRIDKEIRRLESVSREVGFGAPFAFAQNVRAKVLVDEATWGKDTLSVHFDFMAPIPACIPWPGKAKRTAEAFAWAMAHPDEGLLPPKPRPSP